MLRCVVLFSRYYIIDYIVELGFREGYGVPWMSFSTSLSLFVSLFLAFVRWFAIPRVYDVL